jgi:hypothetical protein
MNEQTPVTFTLGELWLLHAVVRHEMQGQDAWRFPPASLPLNEEIACAIDACEGAGMADYTLALTRGDLLVLDYTVPGDAKDANGAAVGRSILRKVFRARRRLAEGELPTAEMADAPFEAERLREWAQPVRPQEEA